MLSAILSFLFILLFRTIGHLSEFIANRTILLATLGGLAIGLIAVAFPQTLFFGEKEINTIVETGSAFGITTLLMIALAKMLAGSCTLHSGFRGGFIFPLFYIGAAVGLAIALALPPLHPTIAMLCMMAAVNVAITKTPVSTTVILSVLSDTAMFSVIVIASFVSFLLTNQVCLIKLAALKYSERLVVGAELWALANSVPAVAKKSLRKIRKATFQLCRSIHPMPKVGSILDQSSIPKQTAPISAS